MTVQQSISGIAFGLASGGVTSGNLNLTATATWGAFGFLQPASDTINTVRLFLTTTGTLASTDLTLDIYSDAPGAPGASLGSVNLGSVPVSGAWNTFSGLSVAVTGGTQYWIVLKNANATPASNNAHYVWIQQINDGPLNGVLSGTRGLGPVVASTTNSGTTWTPSGVGAVNWRIGYSSGAFLGVPVSAFAIDTTKVFSTTEVGTKLVLPGNSNTLYNIAGIAMPVATVGTPTGNPYFRLYTGTSTTATASTNQAVITKALTSSAEWVYLYFSSIQQLTGGTTVRITLADSATDSSSNCYEVGGSFTADSDANSLALMPFADGGSQGIQKTVLSGGTWTDTSTTIFPFAFLPDSSSAEWSANAGGGGGMVVIKPTVLI